jgi:hypothetical protein
MADEAKARALRGAVKKTLNETGFSEAEIRHAWGGQCRRSIARSPRPIAHPQGRSL